MSTTYNMAIVGNASALVATLNVDVQYGQATNVIATKGSKTVALTQQGVLPSGYTQLEYLDSTGTQYIDTNWIPGTGTHSVEIDFEFLTAEGSVLFGGRPESSVNVFGFGADLTSGMQKWQMRSGTATNWNYSTVSPTVGTRYNAVASFTNGSQSLVVDGTTVISSSNSMNLTGMVKQILFGIYTASNSQYACAKFRVWSCVIKTNDAVVRNFIPAKRNSDGALGMYDTANSTFYPNAGTGTFIAGPEMPWSGNLDSLGEWTITAYNADYIRTAVLNANSIGVYEVSIAIPAVPTAYTQLLYINGGQFETPFYPVSSDRIIAKLQANATPTTGSWWVQAYYSSGSGVAIVYGLQDATTYTYISGTNAEDKITWEGVDLAIHDIDFQGGRITDNGVVRTMTNSNAVTTNNVASLKFVLSGGAQYCRVYQAAMYHSDGTLVHYYFPAIRNSDSALILYDVVTNTIVVETYKEQNQGIAGPAI